MTELNLKCSCGGTTTVKVPAGEHIATAECACGRVIFGKIDTPAPAAPPTLGISVGDSVNIDESIQ